MKWLDRLPNITIVTLTIVIAGGLAGGLWWADIIDVAIATGIVASIAYTEGEKAGVRREYERLARTRQLREHHEDTTDDRTN